MRRFCYPVLLWFWGSLPAVISMVWLRVALIFPLIVINTLAHCLPLFVVALFKAVLPLKSVRQACNPLLTGLAESWIAVNSAMIHAFTATRFTVSGTEGLDRDGHYLGQKLY